MQQNNLSERVANDEHLNSQSSLGLSQTLLEILACPACKGEIVHDEAEGKLVCQGECRRRYPIRDGIPVMLIDEAELPA